MNARAGSHGAEIGVGEGMRDDGDVETHTAPVVGGQADAVDGDRPLLHDADAAVLGQHELEDFTAGAIGTSFHEAADAIDMPGDEMAAEAIAEAQSRFAIHFRTRRPLADRRA